MMLKPLMEYLIVKTCLLICQGQDVVNFKEVLFFITKTQTTSQTGHT